MARVAQQLAAEPDFERTSQQVVEFATFAFGATQASLTVVRGGVLRTTGATGAAALEADELQYAVEQGPCVQAALHSETVWSRDLRSDGRWAVFGPQAVALGWCSVRSTHLQAGGLHVGALNLYGDESTTFDHLDTTLLNQFVQHAAIALAHVRKVQDLEIALESRTMIGQAQGVLMERHGISADRAFRVLRRYSQDGNRKLRAVAEDIVEAAVGPARGVDQPTSHGHLGRTPTA